MYYKLTIDETSRNLLKEEPSFFNTITEVFESKELVKEYIIDHYGRMPNGKTKIYRDKDNISQVVGFIHSYWVTGYGDEKAYYQTDWVEVTSVIEKPILL